MSTDKFLSLYAKESRVEVGNFGKVGVEYFTSDSTTLVLRQKLFLF